MLDIKFLREHADVVRDDLRKRKDDDKLPWVDSALAKDEEWRKLKGEADTLRAERNRLSQQVNIVKKAGGDIAPILEQVKEIPERISAMEARSETLEKELKQLLMAFPNVMHETVPYGPDGSGNVVVGLFGKKPTFTFPPKNHTDLIEELGVVDLERAAKVSGARFYYLKGDLAMLDFALQQEAIKFLTSRGFLLVTPPHMMTRAAYDGVTDMGAFEEMIYKVDGEDQYLIATSEHPLTAMYQDEVLDVASLPIKMLGLSPCYRKEAGSHGKEEKGIWRVHQFYKVEQIVICKPEESWEYHEELIHNAVQFFESLGLHFREVNICTGDLGLVAAKKYDLEAWIPSVQEYKEIVSCSNCTTYQAVRLNMKFREGQENKHVHTLNSTLVATSRALVAILEQCQEEDGSIRIPEKLRPYLGGKEHITPIEKIKTC